MIGFVVILSLLAITGLVVMAIDLVPQAAAWIQRIHIGRWRERREWTAAVSAVVETWLRRTPVIPIGDHERLIVLDMLRGRHRSATIQSWQEAALLLGAGEALRRDPGQAKMQQAVAGWLERHFEGNGQWKSPPQQVDGALLGYALMRLPGIDIGHYRPALDHLRTLLVSMTGNDGTIPYRKVQPDFRYVDTLGFVCPFLAAYGRRFKDEPCLALAIRQIESYSGMAMLPEWFIPAHAFDLAQKVPLGIHGWGRGIAWYALGLMGTLKELPPGDPRRERLRDQASALGQALLRLQGTKGGWSAMAFLGPQSPLDSSATTVLGLFLLRMYREFNNPEFLEAARRSAGYLMTVTRRSGIVDFSQGDTKGIGHYSIRYQQMPFTQGFALQLALEILALDEPLAGAG
ncbi:MAG: glycoside hydrolase family 88 protein [Holophagaceae bacterium]|nr:glycoside hydrolase family 88 protein [Holophagaceae bacterium]